MQHGGLAPSQWTIYLDHGVYFGLWWRKTRIGLATQRVLPVGQSHRPRRAFRSLHASCFRCVFWTSVALHVRFHCASFLRQLLNPARQTAGATAYGPLQEDASAPARLYHHSLCMFYVPPGQRLKEPGARRSTAEAHIVVFVQPTNPSYTASTRGGLLLQTPYSILTCCLDGNQDYVSTWRSLEA